MTEYKPKLWKGYGWTSPMAWVLMISLSLPDSIKSKKWKMWEYKDLYRCARCIWNMEGAYFATKNSLRVYSLIEEVKYSRSDEL